LRIGLLRIGLLRIGLRLCFLCGLPSVARVFLPVAEVPQQTLFIGSSSTL